MGDKDFEKKRKDFITENIDIEKMPTNFDIPASSEAIIKGNLPTHRNAFKSRVYEGSVSNEKEKYEKRRSSTEKLVENISSNVARKLLNNEPDKSKLNNDGKFANKKFYLSKRSK